MKVAARELNLIGITLAVILLAVTYLMLEPQFQEWAEFREQRTDLLSRQELAQRRLDSRPEVEARLDEFRRGLPVFAPGKKAEAELLQSLERTAAQHDLRLTRREADAERQAGDLFETAITCYWEGRLEALVNFLHVQQAQGAVLDVRQLSVQPVAGRDVPPGQLKGTFTIHFAYRRDNNPPENKPEPETSAPAGELGSP